MRNWQHLRIGPLCLLCPRAHSHAQQTHERKRSHRNSGCNLFDLCKSHHAPFRFLPAEDVSATAQGSMLSLLGAEYCPVGFHRPRALPGDIEGRNRLAADSTAAETQCNRRSKLKPFHLQWLRAALICRNYGFPDKPRGAGLRELISPWDRLWAG